MEKIAFAGLAIQKISLKSLLLNKSLLVGYFLLALAQVEIYQIFDIRYFSAVFNMYTMSNRFGIGFENTIFYAVASSFIYVSAHFREMLILLDSIGVAMVIYKLFDVHFSVGDLRKNP